MDANNQVRGTLLLMNSTSNRVRDRYLITIRCNIPDNFMTENVSQHMTEWTEILSDLWVFNALKDLKSPFKMFPRQYQCRTHFCSR